VSVLVVTYNHVDYLPAAIESVLAQRTTFPIEILISEDASTDGTRALVESWASRNPERLRLLLSERNVRSNEVVARGLRAARGRYVALLDGDDYWSDHGKLQRQADFLDAHPECTAVFHNARIAIGDRLTDDVWTKPDTGARLGLRTLMQGNPFATCTAMLRIECVRDVPGWYDDFFPITDWPLYTLCAQRGTLAFVDEVSGVYRLHDGGAYSSRPAEAKLDATEGFYRRLAQVAPSLGDAARDGCSRYFFDWAEASLAAGDVPRARDCLRRCLRGGGVGRSVSRRAMLRLGLRLLGHWVRRG
jgi:glycosyltransferase involved in cell wall biosynthesis